MVSECSEDTISTGGGFLNRMDELSNLFIVYLLVTRLP